MPCGKRDIFSKIPKLLGIESTLKIKALDNVFQQPGQALQQVGVAGEHPSGPGDWLPGASAPAL